MSAVPRFVTRLATRVRRLLEPTPEDCLRRLQTMLPQFIAQIDTVQWAQCCLRQAETVVGRRGRHGIVSLGDSQAIDTYEKAFAVAFYGLERQNHAGPLHRVPGSDWSDDQLLRMRSIGLDHGRQLRREAYGPGVREQVSAHEHPPWWMQDAPWSHDAAPVTDAASDSNF